jgi:hypothetical protein
MTCSPLFYSLSDDSTKPFATKETAVEKRGHESLVVLFKFQIMRSAISNHHAMNTN